MTGPPAIAAAPPGVLRLLKVLTLSAAVLAVALAALQLHADAVVANTMTGEVSASEQPSALLGEVARSRLAALPLAAVLALLAGLAGTLLLAWTRGRAAAGCPVLHWRRITVLPAGSPALVRRAARWPQAGLVVPLAALTVAAALALPPADPSGTIATQAAWLLGGLLLAAAFPLLLAERMLAAVPETELPEAPWLRALALLPLLAFPAAGALEIAATKGLPQSAALAAAALALLPCAVAAELALRAAGRCFLPPPPAAAARAAANSAIMRLLAEGAAERSIAVPVRRHLGIDFARSWALAYARAAFAPLALLTVVFGVCLSGVVLVPFDQRAVYERFGAPVRVLKPGLHLILPWPLGRARMVDFGAVHELALTGDPRAEKFAAEDVAPGSADRLWEQENPAEAWFLMASAHDGQQSYYMVSADIRAFWRVGLTDADALRATYAATDPVGLLRQAARRGAAAFFAARTLDAVLGENRETLAAHLRAAVQRELDAAGTGLELASVVIEALHPPGGAADAYHAVQAAEIDAQASISAERGRAFALLSDQRQVAAGLLRGAEAASAEITGSAAADATLFAADRDADRGGQPPFRTERRLAALRAVLATGSLILLDHRIPPGAAFWLDFRPPGAGMVPVPTPGSISQEGG